MAQNDLKSDRKDMLNKWFQSIAPYLNENSDPESIAALVSVSGDASFRKYYRGFHAEKSYILVDVPPGKESCVDFVNIARHFLSEGINVPDVYEVDYSHGFMCLSDLGDTLLLEDLQKTRHQEESLQQATVLYHLAFKQLVKIQSIKLTFPSEKKSFAATSKDFSLPIYDEILLQQEMELFRHWFCEKLLGLELSNAENILLDKIFGFLIQKALNQIQLCVHRDFHSRNLLVDRSENVDAKDKLQLGVIDFQDAVIGPFTYDLVSLLKDCYINWPSHQVNAWAIEYAELACKNNIIAELDPQIFLDDFAMMGIQRHLKAIGIFSRLSIRDGKSAYLEDIPRTLGYIREVASEEKEFKALNEFADWLDARVINKMQEILLS